MTTNLSVDRVMPTGEPASGIKRLSRATLATVPAFVQRPRRQAVPATGIVHFGPGAFHRAHQASYIDTLLDHDPRWGIAAVSLRSGATTEAMAVQDGLYTIAVRDTAPAWRVIAAHTRFLGPSAARETCALLADPAVALVTTTVTEKGYCLAADGTLDLAHPDIKHDLGNVPVPRSVIGWIVAGLAARRSAGIAPFVPMPCDNLADNGAKLHAALIAYARVTDPALADWIATDVRVPSTMVDSITPASDEALYTDVAATLGVEDRAAVQREAFTQWVIEDVGTGSGPDLAAAGAIVTGDVAAYERAKLRILNGAHSTLAYAGLLRGHDSVADAMRDRTLSRFVKTMIAEDIVPVLPRTAGLDLDAYARSVLARFANPAIVHRLEQIAQDGSQKLSYRLADSITANRTEGRMPKRLAAAMGCWVAFVMQRARHGREIADPAGPQLAGLAREGPAADVVGRLLAADLGVRREWADDYALRRAIAASADAALGGDWVNATAD